MLNLCSAIPCNVIMDFCWLVIRNFKSKFAENQQSTFILLTQQDKPKLVPSVVAERSSELRNKTQLYYDMHKVPGSYPTRNIQNGSAFLWTLFLHIILIFFYKIPRLCWWLYLFSSSWLLGSLFVGNTVLVLAISLPCLQEVSQLVRKNKT